MLTRIFHPTCLALACLFAAGCQVAPPDVPADIARATGVDNAIVFRSEGEPIDPAAKLDTLSPAQAIRMALSHDPALQAALAHVRAAEADANQARLLPNPILNIDIRFPHESGSNTAFEATLTGDLVQLLQKPAQTRAADTRLRASAQDAVTTALDVMSEVQIAYAAVQADDALLQNFQQRDGILQKLRDIAQKRLNAGDASKLDTLTLDVQLQEAELDHLEALRQRDEDRYQLVHLIGMPRASIDFAVAPWEAPPGSDGAAEDAWIDAALKHRPEIHSKLYELQALGDDLTAAEFSPFLGSEIGAHTERDPEWRTGPTVTIPLPIFDWGQASRAKIQADRIAARHELADLQGQIIQDVRTAYANAASARHALETAQTKLLPLQRQQLDLAQKTYQAGESDLAALLLAETDLRLTEQKLTQLQQNLATARIKLQRAAGGAAVAAMLESAPAPAPSTAPASAPAQTGNVP